MIAELAEVITTAAKYAGLVSECVSLIRDAFTRPLSAEEVKDGLARIKRREAEITQSVWDTVKS